MEEKVEDYGLSHKSVPPYEVLYTKWLSYKDVLRLKGIEEMVEEYYNSGQFTESLKAMEEKYDSAFVMYDELASYYDEHALYGKSHARAARYEIFLAFAADKDVDRVELYRELLTYDYYLRENAKTRPVFAGEYRMDKETVRRFYENEEREHKYLQGYEAYDKNQMRKMTHLEYFPQMGKTILFDYRKRSPLTKEAETILIAKMP